MASTATALTIVDRVEQSPALLMLDARAQALIDLLPDESAAARFRQVVVQAMVKNPDLLTCQPDSIVLAVFEAAAQGLEPTGAIGGAHLVPYGQGANKRAQLIPDYRGVIRMVTKPGSEVLSLEARVVKEGDVFAYQLGTEAFVEHVPSLEAGRSSKATTHVYAVARLRNGSTIPDVEDRAGIERVQKRQARGNGPWSTDWDEMAKKTIIKRLAKVLPVRPEVRSILVREDELEDQPAAVEGAAAPTRGPKTSRLAARLAKDVTPSEGPGDSGEPSQLPTSTTEPGAAEAAPDDVVDGAFVEAPASLTKEELLSGLETLGVSTAFATERAKSHFGLAPNQQLTPAQRAELLGLLTAEQATSAL